MSNMGNFLPKTMTRTDTRWIAGEMVPPFLSILFLSRLPCPDVGVKTTPGGPRSKLLPSALTSREVNLEKTTTGREKLRDSNGKYLPVSYSPDCESSAYSND